MLNEDEIKIVVRLAKREELISDKNKSFSKYLKMFKEKEQPARIYTAAGKLYEFLFKLDSSKG